MKNFETKIFIFIIVAIILMPFIIFIVLWETTPAKPYNPEPLTLQELEIVIQEQQPLLINALPFLKVETFLESRRITFPLPITLEYQNILQYSTTERISDNITQITLIHASATPPNKVIFISFDYIVRNDGKPLSPEYIHDDLLNYFDVLLEIPIEGISPEITKKWLRDKLPLLTEENPEKITINGITYELSISTFSYKALKPTFSLESLISPDKIITGKSYELKIGK